MQKNLEQYADGRDSYGLGRPAIADHAVTSRSSGNSAHLRSALTSGRDEAYLNVTDAIVLSLNPFFILEDDPTPTRGSQIVRTL